MTTTFYAQPYDISAMGFQFTDAESFTRRAAKARNAYGEAVEEFEIQFIDGERIDAELFRSLSIHQGDVAVFIEKLDEWHEDTKRSVILAVGECGYTFNLGTDDPEDFELDIYDLSNLRELAEYFVDEGLMGDIPEHLVHYIDYDAIARDLSVDFTATEVAGERLVYACR